MRLNDCEFREVWLVDFEFHAPAGHRPKPICLVALELTTGRTIQLFEDELKLDHPPYAIDDDSLFVNYYASAELGCHLALDWPMPAHVLDLFTEFRNLTNGLPTPAGNGLLGALVYHGLDSMEAAVKDTMRDLAKRGGPFSTNEHAALLSYCSDDVTALGRLLEAMLPKLDLPRAILRGRYMKAVAHMERIGVPIDPEALSLLTSNWGNIQDAMIRKIDRNFGVYDGHTFKMNRFEAYLANHGIPWPRLESGHLALDQDTFEVQCCHYPQLTLLRQLRDELSEMRLADLSVGPDSRNRTLLSPFASKTGRNQPSTSKFIFGPAVWLRHLIRPSDGTGIAYCDYEQQEFGIGASLSGDSAMKSAYQSGDPYLRFAVQAHAAPDDATKITHGVIRELFKTCALGTQYGMEFESLARRAARSNSEARELLRAHHQTYRTFWRWSDAVVDQAMLSGKIQTVFGWMLHVTAGTKPRTLRNFPMQGNGSEALRLACSFAIERGVQVCAPIHDALLIEAPLGGLEDAVSITRQAMAEASRIVLDGFELRTEAKCFLAPDRFEDSRGAEMWAAVCETLAEIGGGNLSHGGHAVTG